MYANCMKLFLLLQILASVHGNLVSIKSLGSKDNFFKPNDAVNHLEIFSFAPSFRRQPSLDGIHLSKKAFIPLSNSVNQNASNEYECELDFSTVRPHRSDARSQRSAIRPPLSDARSQRSNARSLRTDARSLRTDARSLRTDARSLRTDARSLRTDARSLRTDTRSLRTDARSLRTDAKSFRTDARSLRTDARSLRTDDRSQRKYYEEERRSTIVKPTRIVFGQGRQSRLPSPSRNTNELRVVTKRNLDSSRRETEFRRVNTRRMESDKLRIRQTRTANNNEHREMMRKEGRVGIIRDNVNINRIRVFNMVENTRRQRNDPLRRESRAISHTDVSRRIRIGEFQILGNNRKSDLRIQSFYRENSEIRNRIMEQKLMVANEFNARRVRNIDATRLERLHERRLISRYTDKVRDHDTSVRKNSRTEITVFRASSPLKHLGNGNIRGRVESRDISVTRERYEDYGRLGKSESRQWVNSERIQRTLRETGNRISISERRQQSLREARNQISISERRQHSLKEAGNRISISEEKQQSVQETASRISKSERRQQSLSEANNRISKSERRQSSLRETQNRDSKSDRRQHSLWNSVNRISKTEKLFSQKSRSYDERIQRREDFRREETLLRIARFDLKQDIWFDEANFSGEKTKTRIQRGRATERFETMTGNRRMAYLVDNEKTENLQWEKSLPKSMDVVIITLLLVCELHAISKEFSSKKMGNISSVFNFLLGKTAA